MPEYRFNEQENRSGLNDNFYNIDFYDIVFYDIRGTNWSAWA